MRHLLKNYAIYFFCFIFALGLIAHPGTNSAFAENESDKTYIIEYHINLGKNEDQPWSMQIKTHDKKMTIQDKFPQVDYKNFIGWNSDPAASEAEYLPGDIYNDNSSLSLYAIWEEPYALEIEEFPYTLEHESLPVSDQIWFAFTVSNPGYYHFYTKDKIKNKGGSSGTGIYMLKDTGFGFSEYTEVVRDTDLTKPNIDLLALLSPDVQYYLGIYVPNKHTLKLQCEIVGE